MGPHYHSETHQMYLNRLRKCVFATKMETCSLVSFALFLLGRLIPGLLFWLVMPSVCHLFIKNKFLNKFEYNISGVFTI